MVMLGTKQTRWADVSDCSEDEPEECLPAPALAADESYMGTPVAFSEDSKEGLNPKFAASAGLDSASRDFAFLAEADEPTEYDIRPLPRLPCEFAYLLEECNSHHHDQRTRYVSLDGASTNPRSAPESVDDVHEDTPQVRQWKPNIYAPEFVPTLSMDCPLVGVCTLHTPKSRTPREALPGCTSPEKDPLPAESLSRKYMQNNGKKRNVFAVPGPDRKRSKDGDRKVLIVEGTRAAAAKKTPASKEASEDDWRSRADRRQKFIDAVCRLPEYQRFLQASGSEQQCPGATWMPDPRDRTISNRRWKWLFAQWRVALKHNYGDGCESMLSTEEWQSTPSMESTSAVEDHEWQSGFTASSQDASALEVEDSALNDVACA